MSSDDERDISGDEEQVDENPSSSEVAVKYKAAGQAANTVIAKLISEISAGKTILELCELGDKLIVAEVQSLYKKQKNIQKGIAFPTCISVNHVCGHYSAEAGDKAVLNAGDVVKIDLGVHVDGFIAAAAHTHVVGNSQGAPTSGKAADVICAAAIAADAVLRLIKPGKKNTEIASVVQTVAQTFKVNTVEAVLSHQMKRFVIDGTKVIPNKILADQGVEEFEFDEGDVYAVDIVMSTGEGKTREMDLRPTIYKRAVDENYSLKLQASRKVFSEINSKYPALPFTIRALEDKHVRFGLSELEKHGLINSYPVLYERPGELVAQFKYTVIVGPSGAQRITEQPLPYVQSQYSVEDAEVKALLSQTVSHKKKTKKKSNKKPKTEGSSAATPIPMDTN